MYSPGDVVHFYSEDKQDFKYYLCVSSENDFIYLNSPKSKIYPGNLEVDCSEFAGIPATASGKSIICCTLVMRKTDAQLRSARAKPKGKCSTGLLKRILDFVEDNEDVVADDQKTIIDGLADWL